MLLSEPAGAQVMVNGKQVCVTPCTYDYTTGSSGEIYQVVLDKEGFSPVLYQMKADEVDRQARSSLWTAGLMIPGGSLLWLGSIFTSKLKESYHFVLREELPVVAMNETNVGE
jgi:hypothetical protein